MLLFSYTHDPKLMDEVLNFKEKLEKHILSDMFDGARRRYQVLFHAIIPYAIEELVKHNRQDIVIKKLGSGIGFDILNAVEKTNDYVSEVLNYSEIIYGMYTLPYKSLRNKHKGFP
jgi:hypothetical protein